MPASLGEFWDDEDDELDLDFEVFVPMREPTILEMMLLLRFFRTYGQKSVAPSKNLLSMVDDLDLPDDALAYMLWMKLRED